MIWGGCSHMGKSGERFCRDCPRVRASCSPPGGLCLLVQSVIAPTSPSKSLNTSGQASTSLLLFRMGDVILKCARHPTRPLLHLMQAWSVVAPHLVEVGSSVPYTLCTVASQSHLLCARLPLNAIYSVHGCLSVPYTLCLVAFQSHILCAQLPISPVYSVHGCLSV